MPPERRQQSPQSIRVYRARTIRPCDNCRSRRQRCVIPVANEPCTLCESTRKDCTFLRERPKAGRRQSAARQMNHEDETRERTEQPRRLEGPQSPLWLDPPPSFPDSVPLAELNFAPTPASVSSLLTFAYTPSANTVISPELSRHVALDVDAAADEELYLLGTAFETDALMLNTMTDHLPRSSNPPRGPIGLRVRKVSFNPPVSFIFYRSLPYGSEADDLAAWTRIEGLLGPSLVDGILYNFFDIEAQGHPIWPARDQLDDHMAGSSLSLRSFCVTAGLIYTPSLRHLHREAYIFTMGHLRQKSCRARLWTMQIYLMDLDGRQAINPSGNFVTLGMAISVAKLLGLHEDCSAWTIPEWEKRLRSNLWWSLFVYDRFSSIIFGRPRSITHPNTVPLPPISTAGAPSKEAFIAKCELALLLDDLSPDASSCHCHPTSTRISRLTHTGSRLDQWSSAVAHRGLFSSTAPGVRSLHLLALGARLILVRSMWDVVNEANIDPTAARQACLTVCHEVVDFVETLSPNDLNGYWSSHSPYILSMCLAQLVRIVANSADSAEIRADVVILLQSYVSRLTSHEQIYNWDPANLAQSRAHYFIPLLSKSNPDFGLVLQPANDDPSVPNDATLDEFMRTLAEYGGFEELLR